ncbi:hypothetical protein [Sphingobium olei]|uniref:Uncharacterized protein n=1 Tax=Sphingobium olei TaxID=420955 RepID=A0ABW3P5H8_9SPHN
MKDSPKFRSHTPVSYRIKWLTVSLFSLAMFAFSAWIAVDGIISGSISEFSRHSDATVSLDQHPASFAVTLAIWVGVSIFFAAGTVGAAKLLLER